MSTLSQVQKSIDAQLIRDYKDYPYAKVIQIVLYGLCEETGEVLGLAKRKLRNQKERDDMARSSRKHFIEELGDVLWYLTACCALVGTSLEEIWEQNEAKLKERYGE